jgi:hypothetical protein
MSDLIIKILISILFLLGAIFFVINQKKNIKEWLLYAVIKAEKELGSNTGKIKLRQVYDEFIKTFPLLSKFIKFNYFSNLVDLSLIEMKKLLNNNIQCKLYVNGDNNV